MRSTYGLNIVYVRFSAIFSTPRCRYPITHSSPRTFSPSSRRMTRSTPCVAGCCGPMLMTSSLASRNVLSGVSRSSGESALGSVNVYLSQASSRSLALLPARRGISRGVSRQPAGNPRLTAFAARPQAPSRRLDLRGCFLSLSALNPQIDLHPLIILLQDAVVFAQRISLPSVRQQNALQIRMSVELNPKHVENFTLQPVGGRPQRNRARQALAIYNQRLHPNAFVARKRVQHPYHVELLFALGIMHRCDVHAVVELLPVPQNMQNLRNQRAINHHVVLAEIAQRLNAGTAFRFELRHHRRIPRNRNRCRGFRRRRGGLGCGRSCGPRSRGFRWSGSRGGLVGGRFRF